MRYALLLPLFFCVCSMAWGLESLSDNELGAAHPMTLGDADKELNPVHSAQTSTGQMLFFANRYVPECNVSQASASEEEQKNRLDKPYANCDEKTVSITPIKRVSVAEFLASLPKLPERPTAFKLGKDQIIFLDLGLNDNIAINLGRSGEIMYLQDVVLTRDGKPAVIGPIKTSITTSDVQNGMSQLELNSDITLNASLNIGAVKFAKHIDVAPNATSIGSIFVGNILANVKSKIYLNRR